MSNSILLTIKKMLGLTEEYTAFDLDIIVLINSAFMTLEQLGVGSQKHFKIHDATETWDDYFKDSLTNNESVKEYIFLKVKLVFDSSTMQSALLNAYKEEVRELEWRLQLENEQ